MEELKETTSMANAVTIKNSDVDKVIEFKNVCKSFKGRQVLKNITLTVNKGDIYGFVGENGAGKSTAMRVLAGVINIDSGEYFINGVSSKSKGIYNARKSIGAIIEAPVLFKSLSAEENLSMNLILAGKTPDKEKIKNVLTAVGLGNEIGTKKKTGNFSLGMRQRLGIAMAFVNDVDILILDEPINGLDPKGIVEIRNLIEELHNKGVTIFISSHILSELSLIATRYGFISHGRLVKEISKEDLDLSLAHKTIIKTENNEYTKSLLDGIVSKIEIKEDGIYLMGEYDINEVLKTLVNNNVQILNITTQTPSVEEYYMNVIKGAEENERSN